MISASARRLSVFKSVVDCGGFNVAANALGIAQPSVGAHIKALEAQLGQPLFLRNRGSRPRLTKAGEAVYAFAVDVLQRSEVATRTLAGLRSVATQEITIAVHRDIAAHFLPERLTAFTSNNPKVHVITRIGTIDEVIGLIRTRAATVGLFLGLKPISGIRCEALGHERLALVVTPKHPLAGKRVVAPDELGALPVRDRFAQFALLPDDRCGAEGHRREVLRRCHGSRGIDGNQRDGAPRARDRVPVAVYGRERTRCRFTGIARAGDRSSATEAILRLHRAAERKRAKLHEMSSHWSASALRLRQSYSPFHCGGRLLRNASSPSRKSLLM